MASSFSAGSLKPQRRLHLAPLLLLAENVGDVIGAEGACGVRFGERGGYRFRAIFTNQSEQFAHLARQGAVRIGEPSQIFFRRRVRAARSIAAASPSVAPAAICA